MARLGIDFDHRQMSPVGEHEVRRVVERSGFETGFHALGHVPGDIGHQGDVLDGLAGVGSALDEEPAIVVVHVLDSRFKQVSGDDHGLVADLAGGQSERSPADGSGAATVRAPPHRGVVRVAVHDLDVVGGHADFSSDDLGERGFLALAVRRGADHHVNLAARVEADDRALPKTALEADRAGNLGRSQPADFHVGRKPESDVPALLSRRGLVGPQLVVAGFVHELRQRPAVVAAVIGQARHYVVAVVELRDEVQTPKLGRILAELGCQQVDESFDHEGRLGASRTAIRLDRCGVGVDPVDILVNRRNVVHAGQHQAMQDRRDPGCRRGQVCAHASPNRGA